MDTYLAVTLMAIGTYAVTLKILLHLLQTYFRLTKKNFFIIAVNPLCTVGIIMSILQIPPQEPPLFQLFMIPGVIVYPMSLAILTNEPAEENMTIETVSNGSDASQEGE